MLPKTRKSSILERRSYQTVEFWPGYKFIVFRKLQIFFKVKIGIKNFGKNYNQEFFFLNFKWSYIVFWEASIFRGLGLGLCQQKFFEPFKNKF